MSMVVHSGIPALVCQHWLNDQWRDLTLTLDYPYQAERVSKMARWSTATANASSAVLQRGCDEGGLALRCLPWLRLSRWVVGELEGEMAERCARAIGEWCYDGDA